MNLNNSFIKEFLVKLAEETGSESVAVKFIFSKDKYTSIDTYCIKNTVCAVDVNRTDSNSFADFNYEAVKDSIEKDFAERISSEKEDTINKIKNLTDKLRELNDE